MKENSQICVYVFSRETLHFGLLNVDVFSFVFAPAK